MNLRDALRSRMSHEQLGLVLRLADWVVSHPGEILTEAEVINLSNVHYPQSMVRAMIHDALYTVGGPDRLDFSGPLKIEWPKASEILRYPRGNKNTPRGKSSVTAAPQSFTAEQWQTLWVKIWKNRPWLIFPGQSEEVRHCTPRWVRQEVTQCLEWFRGKGTKRADWIATAYVWLSKSDDRLLERAGTDLSSPAAFHRLAKERPDQYWPEVIPGGQ